MSGEQQTRRARQLIIVLLLRVRGKLRASELAKVLGVSSRTIARDCTELEMLGIPVRATRGAQGGLSLYPDVRVELARFTDPSVTHARATLPAAMDTDPEGESRALEHVRLAVRSLLERTDARLRQDAESALAAIELGGVQPSAPLDADVLRTLRSALWLGRRVRLAYPARGKLHERDVSPLVLVAYEGIWYLSGYCHWRRDVRTFVVSRIAHARQLDARAPAAQQAVLVGDPHPDHLPTA